MKTRSLVPVALLLLVAGCAGPRERAEKLALETNPLTKARPGDICRYRAVREGDAAGAAVAETWTLRVASASKGQARVDVAVLGPARTPAGPSPREPGWSLKMPTADAGLSAVELIRLFHRPELTTEGMLVVLDRDVTTVEGEKRSAPGSVLGRTATTHELAFTFKDPLVKATYTIVFADDVPVVGIAQATLEEEWQRVDEDGQIRTEKRTDRLELVDARSATDSR